MMSTLTNAWWRVAAVAAAGALTIPAWAAPAASAPSGPDVADALRLRAALAEQLRGVQLGSAAGVDDGYPGGGWVATGTGFSCSAGMLQTYCWGAGTAGQLGTGSTTDSAEPAEVDGAGEFREGPVGAVAAGQAHACALSWFDESEDGGTLFCWGDNAQGQVGDGTTTPRSKPVEVAGGMRQVATGARHTCAITVDVGVACWGRNDEGQLGSGTTGVPVSEPQAVPGLDEVIDLAAGGDTTCALDKPGRAWCWGSDSDGQLGNGADPASAAPVAVDLTGVDDEFQQIEVGDRHACAVTSDGVVWCWGDDSSGQLGDGGATADPSAPVQVTIAEKVVSVSAGGDSTCAVLDSGTVQCWGANAQGQLGTGDRTDSDAPVEVDTSNVPPVPFPGLTESAGGRATAAEDGPLVDVSVGDAHACALDFAGNAFCWGDDSRGQIGDGATGDALIPVPTTLLPDPATDLEVTPGDSELSVTWTAPADVGSSDLLGSIAIGFADDDDDFGGGACKGESDACVLGGLRNGTDYQVVVLTQTEGGMSLSAAVPGTPVGRPSAPPAPGGGGQLPITGAAVSTIIAAGGALVLGGLFVLRLVRRRTA